MTRRFLAAVVIVSVLMATGLYAIFSPNQAQASTVSLTVLEGSPTIVRASGALSAGQDGQQVAAGDTIKTGTDGYAVITYFDGSTVTLEPNTELTVEVLQATPSGGIVVRMFQAIGSTWHVVTRTLKPGSSYELRTPVSTATVRGTAFTVTSEANGDTNVQTVDGVVATSADGSTVDVTQGLETNVTAGRAPAPPVASPEADSMVTIVIGAPTTNAVVSDQRGRSIGVRDGLPIRSIPGSKVGVNEDGQLVLRFPQKEEDARLSTIVKVPAFVDSVPIETQVTRRGAGTTTSLEVRPVTDGSARGGVVLTGDGTVVLPQREADRFIAPKLGTLPAGPVSVLPFGERVDAKKLVTAVARSAGENANTGTQQVEARKNESGRSAADDGKSKDRKDDGNHGGFGPGAALPAVNVRALAASAGEFANGGFVARQSSGNDQPGGGGGNTSGFVRFTEAPAASFFSAPPAGTDRESKEGKEGKEGKDGASSSKNTANRAKELSAEITRLLPAPARRDAPAGAQGAAANRPPVTAAGPTTGQTGGQSASQSGGAAPQPQQQPARPAAPAAQPPQNQGQGNQQRPAAQPPAIVPPPAPAVPPPNAGTGGNTTRGGGSTPERVTAPERPVAEKEKAEKEDKGSARENEKESKENGKDEK